MVHGRGDGSKAGCEDMDTPDVAVGGQGECSAARRADGDKLCYADGSAKFELEYSLGVIDFHSSLVNDNGRDSDGAEVRRECH